MKTCTGAWAVERKGELHESQIQRSKAHWVARRVGRRHRHRRLSSAPSIAASCETVVGLKIDNTTIDAGERIAGAYTPAGGAEIVGRASAFCRVRGAVRPVEGSKVGFEVWLPEADWNGKIEMLGNGGYSSAIPYSAMAEQLKRVYAVVAQTAR